MKYQQIMLLNRLAVISKVTQISVCELVFLLQYAVFPQTSFCALGKYYQDLTVDHNQLLIKTFPTAFVIPTLR